MRPRSLSVCAAALALGTAGAAAQSAAPEAIALRWTAPAGCPDKAAVKARIERLLGGPARSSDIRLDAAGTMEESAGAFRLEVVISNGASESKRILQGAACSSLSDAGALVIALAFDPEAVAAQQSKAAESAEPGAPSAPAPEATAAPSAAPAPANAPEAAPRPTAVIRIPVPLPLPAPATPPPPSRFSFGGFAELVFDAGSLPSVAPGVRAGLSLGIGPFRIEPSFEAWPSAKSSLADGSGAGAELRLLAFALDACRRVLPWSAAEPRLAAFACLGFEIGEMHGAGFGVPAPGSGSVLWTAPRFEARGELSLTRWAALRFDAGVAVPLDPRRFVLDLNGAPAVVHQPSAAVGRAALGLSLRF